MLEKLHFNEHGKSGQKEGKKHSKKSKIKIEYTRKIHGKFRAFLI